MKFCIVQLAFAAVTPFVCLGASEEEPMGVDQWGRERHPAVIDPVLGQDPAWVLSLNGEWEFAVRWNAPDHNASWGDRFQLEKVWKSQGGYSSLKDGEKAVAKLPGFVEDQGFGVPSETRRAWACWWDGGSGPLDDFFKGHAWYRRTVTIPESWKGRRIWLKTGAVRSQGWFWVNDEQVAWVQSYGGTYKYEITDLVTPGKPAKFVIEVTSDLPSRRGGWDSIRKYTGIERGVELEATPMTWIDDAFVRGDFDARTAEARVKVEGVDGAAKSGRSVRVTVEGKTASAPVTASGTVSVRVPLDKFRPWSPEQPNLYVAEIELVENGKVTHARRERFGVRKIEVRGKDIYLNNRLYFLRGVGYHAKDFAYGQARNWEREYRREVVRKMKEFGFNFCRTHCRVEFPEFFEACDEEGFLVQGELPYYNDLPCEHFDFNPVRDVKELYVHFRRYPSFAVYSHGNEGGFGPSLAKKLYSMMKALDPDRLVIEQDGDCFSATPHCRSFNLPGTSDMVGGPIKPWKRGSCQADRPIIAHEYLNLSVKANALLEDEYKKYGRKAPFDREMRRAWLKKFGLTDRWGDRLQLAQHVLQSHWFKHGIESARLDPWCDGYLYWSMHDCMAKNGSAYMAQGLVDPFGNVKPEGSTPAYTLQFNAPSAVLCDSWPESRILASGDTLTNAVYLAHYGEKDVRAAKLDWSLVTEKGEVLGSGSTAVGDQAVGAVRKIADVSVRVPDIKRATRAKLKLSVDAIANEWNVWLFPKREVKSGSWICFTGKTASLASRYSGTLPAEKVAEAKIVVAEYGSDAAKAAAARGQRVLEIGKTDTPENIHLGWWWIGNLVGAAMADVPAFAYLPHSGRLDGLFFRIFRTGVELPLAGVKEEDLDCVCEGGENCLAYLYRQRDGKTLVSLGFDVYADLPESKALLDGLIESLGPVH